MQSRSVKERAILTARMSERRKTVLVVDDDEGMHDRLTAVLRRDYHVLCAATGEVTL